jgi:hypothetical protein
LRGELKEYRAELGQLYHWVKRQPKLKAAARLWVRWRDHPDFPSAGTARERLVFAIEQHCQEAETTKFHLACRDAGDVIGASNFTASKLLLEMRQCRIISLAGGPHGFRQAAHYQLLRSNT